MLVGVLVLVRVSVGVSGYWDIGVLVGVLRYWSGYRDFGIGIGRGIGIGLGIGIGWGIGWGIGP